MIKVGITGGIGSGKTTFCKEWEKLGAFVLYADDFAKQLMNEDKELKKKIMSAFGDRAYDRDGNINRDYLAKEAFEKGRVQELNDLVHPVLRARTKELAVKKEKEGIEVFAKEAAVLLNNGRPEELDFVVLLLADESRRIERTVERDESSEPLVKNRISRQPDFNQLIHLADFIVTNNENLQKLKLKAVEIFKEVKKSA
ncbi:MAG: dephospho-CoA kinase [Gracilimonas sp.]|uniref:dephospho-CoA kinase n=1 Tax=Gracilimonas sp. TaxID=1974203 RepID=UPI0019CA300E|nr:dephospho-CoA kinase [Gracilimonas sp.]MBD3615645.1 dephospho-CoA kinase [Gracilimonas sp.]